MTPTTPKPWWLKLIIIVAMLPVVAFPTLLGYVDAAPDQTTKSLLVFYPAYVLVAGLCAWICYPSRPAVTWILVALMLMTHAAMWVLVRG